MAAYAAHDVLIKFLGASLSPLQIAFLIALFGLPPVVLRLAMEQEGFALRPRRPAWVAARTRGMMLAALGAIAAFAALPLTQVYAILFSAPLLITALSVPILGERVGAVRWAAIAVGLCGVLIVLRPGQSPLSWAHLAALASALGSAVAAVIARRLGDTERASVLVLWPILMNLAVSAAALPWAWRPMGAGQLALGALIAALSLAGAVLSLLAYRRAEAAVVAPMQYSQILWAALYGWLFFAETPDGPTLLGVAVIVGSGLYILWREARGGPVTESVRAGDAVASPRPEGNPLA